MDNTQRIIEQARRQAALRAGTTVAARSERPWLWAFTGLGLCLALGVLLLPMGSLDQRLQMVVHGVCAQAHYLNLGGVRLPLCARNTGIYAGAASTILFLIALGRGRAAKLPPILITLVLVLGVMAMGVDGVNSLLLDMGGYNLYPPSNELRVVTGLLMGAAMGVFMLLMFNVALRRPTLNPQPVLGSWIEFVALLLVNAAVYVLIFWGPSALYYPLALLSVAGIVGVLFLANMFAVSMLSGLEGRVTRLQQLARAATIGLALTTAELALLSGFRVWVETSLGI